MDKISISMRDFYQLEHQRLHKVEHKSCFIFLNIVDANMPNAII